MVVKPSTILPISIEILLKIIECKRVCKLKTDRYITLIFQT